MDITALNKVYSTLKLIIFLAQLHPIFLLNSFGIGASHLSASRCQ